MDSTPNIEKILSALREYPWTKGGPIKEENGVKKFDTISTLLFQAGVPECELPKLTMANTWQLYGSVLAKEYGLKDNTDYYLVLIAGDNAISQDDMLKRIWGVLNGDLNAIAPSHRTWIASLVEQRGKSDSALPKTNSQKLATFIPLPAPMKPCLKNRQTVETWATLTWEATLDYRVYSCPDTPEYDFLLGADALVLKNKQTKARIPLEVVGVTKVPPVEFQTLNRLANPFRERASSYLACVGNNQEIIHPGCAHRLYFLSTEPWPSKMELLTASVPPTEWAAILSICGEPDRFFRWPQASELLWKGCVRAKKDGEYVFPPELVTLLRRMKLTPDTRTNGPAINSFQAAGGKRPRWNGEGWHIHHVFDGTEGSPHAVEDGNLFTHSAGLVAAHPVAHEFAHRSALLKWLLRRESFLRFGFDPKGDFVAT